MVDVHTPEQRSRNMSRIRSKDTRPELIVRSVVHRLGFRFRLHRRDLPGTPDLVFPRHRKVIFVHGCYWHLHDCRSGRVVPRTNAAFWATKRATNAQRDADALEQLTRLGWKTLVVWECTLRDAVRAERLIQKFLTR